MNRSRKFQVQEKQQSDYFYSGHTMIPVISEISSKAANVLTDATQGMLNIFAAAFGTSLGNSFGVLLTSSADALSLAKNLFRVIDFLILVAFKKRNGLFGAI